MVEKKTLTKVMYRRQTKRKISTNFLHQTDTKMFYDVIYKFMLDSSFKLLIITHQNQI